MEVKCFIQLEESVQVYKEQNMTFLISANA